MAGPPLVVGDLFTFFLYFECLLALSIYYLYFLIFCLSVFISAAFWFICSQASLCGVIGLVSAPSCRLQHNDDAIATFAR